jgi:intracellular septation protein A
MLKEMMPEKMKVMHVSWRKLLDDCLTLVCVFGIIGIALKFTTFFDKWVYFPSFPNIFDATFLISSGIFLAWKSRRRMP